MQDVAPVVATYLPASHDVQDDIPVVAAYVPARQLLHDETAAAL